MSPARPASWCPAIAAVLLPLVLLAGCGTRRLRGKYPDNPGNPYKTIKKIAIAPLINMSGNAAVDVREAANIMASEIVQFPGFEVVRPAILQTVADRMDMQLRTFEDYRRIAKESGADAALIVGIMEYEAYPPPVIALALELVPTNRITMERVNIQDLIQQANPLPITREQAEFGTRFVEVVVDAHLEATAVEIRGYARRHEVGRTGLREDAYTMISEHFIQFACNKAMQALIALEGADRPIDATHRDRRMTQ